MTTFNTRIVTLTDTNTNTFIILVYNTRMLVGDGVAPALDERASPTGIRRVSDERDHRHSGTAHEHDQPADMGIDSKAHWFATCFLVRLPLPYIALVLPIEVYILNLVRLLQGCAVMRRRRQWSWWSCTQSSPPTCPLPRDTKFSRWYIF